MKATLPKYVTIRTDIYYLLMPSYVCFFVCLFLKYRTCSLNIEDSKEVSYNVLVKTQ